jgi:hypothetical protein
MEHVFTGPAPGMEDYGDTSLTCYWNNHSLLSGFTDENNLSLVVFVTCGQHKFIFPGDIEKEGWRQLLRNPNFMAELRGLHHKAPTAVVVAVIVRRILSQLRNNATVCI